MYEKSELNAFKKIDFDNVISSNFPNNLFQINIYKAIELC